MLAEKPGGLTILDSKGVAKGCELNVKLFLDEDKRYEGLLYDEFRARTLYGTRDWSDHDDRELLVYIQESLHAPGFTLAHVRNGAQAFAFERRIDSLQLHLKSLPKWDGESRIGRAFIEAWGAPDTPLVRAASRNFFISMIARAVVPGAQVDTLWVLEGPQGKLKSRSLRELGGEFHAEISAPIGTNDFFRELRGVWIAELSELDSLRGREASTVKRLLSAVTDRYVEKYERHATAYPRRAIFTATTNEAAYWQDSTGARRLVPIRVGEIDLVQIKLQREQWLAEALRAYLDGASWWEFPASISVAQEDRQQIDPWEDLLRGAMERGRYDGPNAVHVTWPLGFVSSAEIMAEWLRLHPHQQGAASGVRLGKCMRRLGFVPVRHGKARERGWMPQADAQGHADG